MYLKFLFKTSAILLITLFLLTPTSYSGRAIPETDNSIFEMVSFFDLRDRETYIQVTNIESFGGTVHVQIFDASNNCIENDFFDTYTGNDTHVYNMRDIQTNNGNPSGVVLPEGSYGFMSVLSIDPSTGSFERINRIIGNFRIIDNNGYEYRTNSVGFGDCCVINTSLIQPTFNFNTKNGIILSDVFVISFFRDGEVIAADINSIFVPFDVDIINENEIPFSCRNVIFACTDSDNPLNESLLEQVGVANVASFEYGINNAIPHSKGGELLCPGNIISEGIVTLSLIQTDTVRPLFVGFIGLNNGNNRGTMDSIWDPNLEVIIANRG